MAGSATIDESVLLDGLLGTVDELRDLGRQFGVSAFRMFRVRRTWASGSVGEGPFADVLTEVLPRPVVEPFTDSLGRRLEPCGFMEAGIVKVSEVSLTYTYDELNGGALPSGQEHLLLLREGYGQGQPDRLFRLDRAPFPDRVDSIGWVMWLRLQQAVQVPTQVAELEAATMVLAAEDVAA